MDEIEIIRLKIPLNDYEKRTTALVDALLEIDEHIFESKTLNLSQEVL
jgi:hypothetical protein